LASAKAEALKDSKGRTIPTVIAQPISERERLEVEGNTESDEGALLIAIAENERASFARLAKALGWLSPKDGTPNKAKVHRCAETLKKNKYIKDAPGALKITAKGNEEAIRLKINRDLAVGRCGRSETVETSETPEQKPKQK
jgi:hypothetical protein